MKVERGLEFILDGKKYVVTCVKPWLENTRLVHFAETLETRGGFFLDYNDFIEAIKPT